jgi:hypothetical protein
MNVKQVMTMIAALGLFFLGSSAFARGGNGGGGGGGGGGGRHGGGGEEDPTGTDPGSTLWIAFSSAAKELGALLSSAAITQDSALALKVTMTNQMAQVGVETSDSSYTDYCVLEERTLSLDCGNSPYYVQPIDLEIGSQSWGLAASLEQVLRSPVPVSGDSDATFTATVRRTRDGVYAVAVESPLGAVSYSCTLAPGEAPAVTCAAD